MSKCNICGADLAPGAKFCTGCGTPVPQDLNPAPAAPASTAFQQAVSSSAGNPTAFEQAVSSNNAPKNIYSDVPQYRQPDAGTSQPVGAQPGFNGQPPVGGQPGFNGQPPVGAQPDFNGQPPVGGQPDFSSQPPVGGQPDFSGQQPVGGQPDFSGQQPVGGQPDFSGQQPVGGQPGANSFYYGQPPMQPQKKKTGLIAGIVAAVVAALAIIIILIVVLSTRNTYKTPIEKFEKGINNRDTSTLMEAFPLNPEHPSLYKIAGESVGDYVLDDFDSEFDGQKIKIEITGKEKLTQLQLSNAEDSIYASLYGSDYKLTSGYRVYCTISVIGDDSYEPEDSTITVCKLDGKWYIFGID